MDIYFEGKTLQNETIEEARVRILKKYKFPFKGILTINETTEIQLKYQKAIFYSIKNKDKDIMWRQWIIIEKNICFLIVSAIKSKDENAVFPDVDKMVNSFKIIE
jgi:hypothetical protein